MSERDGEKRGGRRAVKPEVKNKGEHRSGRGNWQSGVGEKYAECVV